MIKVGVEMEVGPRSKERQNRHQRHRRRPGEDTAETGGILPQAKKPLGHQGWKRQGRFSPRTFRGTMALLTP